MAALNLKYQIMGTALRYAAFVFTGALMFACATAFAAGRDGGAPRPAVIVLDPGHGGEDSGAMGPRGVEEKNVTLALAKRLASELREKTGAIVLLTRTEDLFVPLRERTAFANRNNADIFVSIHANSTGSKGVAGVETFFLSYDPTDEDARKLAAIENAPPPQASSGAELSDELQEILVDLTQAVAHHESSALAEAVQASLAAGRADRGVKQAPFTVLSGANMPAVLVEVGFLSNPDEAKRLSADAGQAKIADSILKGITAFTGLQEKKNALTVYRQTTQKDGRQGF